jgi:hypothetical protein
MVIDIDGILEDGSPRRDRAAPRRVLRWPRGSTVTIRLGVTSASGQPVNLTGATLELLVTRRSSGDAILKRVAASTSGSSATFEIDPGDASTLPAGKYAYSVRMMLDGRRDYLVQASELVIDLAPQ